MNNKYIARLKKSYKNKNAQKISGFKINENDRKRLLSSGLFIFLGILSLGLITTNHEINSDSSEGVSSRILATSEINTQRPAQKIMPELIYGQPEIMEPQSVDAMLERQTKLITTRRAFYPSLAVIQKNDKTIREAAERHGIPTEVALGIGFLENGGSETAVSSAGAAGVFQLMPGTARDLGLRVDRHVDQRRDPATNIDAGMRYLAKNYRIFGDWGLTIWSYHAGEGNVARALRVYALANHGVTLPTGFSGSNTAIWRDYIDKHELTIDKLLSDPSVQAQVTNRLNDDSAGYPYKVMATAKIYELANEIGLEELTARMALLNTNVISVNEFFATE